MEICYVSYVTVDAIDTEWGKSNKIASSSILGGKTTMNKYINKSLRQQTNTFVVLCLIIFLTPYTVVSSLAELQ